MRRLGRRYQGGTRHQEALSGGFKSGARVARAATMPADTACRAAALGATVALLVAVVAVVSGQGGPPGGGGPPSQPDPDDAPSNKRDFYFVINEVITNASSKFFNIIDINVEKWSKECSYVDGLVEILEDVPEDTIIQINSENMQGSTWSALAPTGPMPLCSYMVEQKDKMEMLWRASNLTRQCPILKNGMFLKRFTVMETVFPLKLTGDDWRVVIILVHQGEEILNVKVAVSKLPIEKRDKCDEEQEDDEEDEDAE
ncbi:uncharacterized protein LOC126235100 [Schistocerca nitens]|uniref:uncharacterized protein LOC126235100 n=1 Tax=Schistocerca nitens TaxID=7011 RepID=UPI00211947C7|nr:uncharacterized protein LOC126235100 [Schistocerca nitens]